ncbi:hypothetical protein O181_098066 [Austropuccinia psidii MF-1]|uniref:Uncharacterized protein n=1 Tax=Austropuccinia psidii MF-1 TaxID=1389203 RepID=A0A9Q3PFM5_9BASI|nr:hypothetical protein [Austropuccinia psidii MF-1]
MKTPQASQSAKYRQESPKEQPEKQEKGKVQVEKALPSELQDSEERKESHGKCVQYGKNFEGIENKEEKIINQYFPKK